ncbi:MAG: hypothetical protein IJP92_02995, partial [Lachnospiraceae bacterium]|nr:hypothetical protein [Lachnospiraceae bacterium]
MRTIGRTKKRSALMLCLVLMTALLAGCGASGEKPAATTARESSETSETPETAPSSVDAQALFEEGRAYYYALNGERNLDQARDCFEQAAAGGVADAWYYYGVLCEQDYEYDRAAEA